MLDLDRAPHVGALVVRKETWEKIPAANRAVLLAHATTTGRGITVAGHREMKESVAPMEKRDLKAIKPNAAAMAEWLSLADSAQRHEAR